MPFYFQFYYRTGKLDTVKNILCISDDNNNDNNNNMINFNIILLLLYNINSDNHK